MGFTLLAIYCANSGFSTIVKSSVRPIPPTSVMVGLYSAEEQYAADPRSLNKATNELYLNSGINFNWNVVFPARKEGTMLGSMSFRQSIKRSLRGRMDASRAFASASAFVDKSYWWASSSVALLNTAKFDSVFSARSFAKETLSSSFFPSFMECPRAKSSIITPRATIAINLDSSLWCSSFSFLLRPAGWWCNHHSPLHPTATSNAAIISKETQNQNEDKRKNPSDIKDIVATIPEIIFGVLLFVGICIFWINWFSNAPYKK